MSLRQRQFTLEVLESLNLPQFPSFKHNRNSEPALFKQLLQNATLVEEWRLDFGEQALYREASGDFWLVSRALGSIHFNLVSSEIETHPNPDVDPAKFVQMVLREWLPLVYQMWGYQVLHASAALHLASHQVIAFSGLAGAGKSTLGYGLGQRPGWQQIADESLAMLVEKEHVRLSPIPNFIRLRDTSASYYGQQSLEARWLDWPEGEINLRHILFLDDAQTVVASPRPPVQIIPLDGVEAYTQLLHNAFALTLKLREESQRLMENYLQVARRIPAHRLIFPKELSVIDDVLDLIEELVLATGRDNP